MGSLQTVFTNREIALGIWGLLFFVIIIFTKPAKEFLKTTIPILFCKKFVIFYLIFLSVFSIIIYGLHWVGFWDTSLLKDTIVWVVFIEIPIFVRTIKKAKDNRFFIHLIKDNIALIAIIEFVLNYWSFGIVVELIIIPCSVILGILYAIASREKKYQRVKRILDGLLILVGVVIIAFSIKNVVEAPLEIFNISALKELTLPFILLLLNIPVVYGLAIYNMYEQLFIRVKGEKDERLKIKRRLMLFAGISFSKLAAIRDNISSTLVISLTECTLRENLDKLQESLTLQIGANYMKRSHFYIASCILGLVVSIIGLICCNSQVSLKDIITLNFVFDIGRLKEIVTYICATSLVFSISLLLFSVGLKKKKFEDISQVKKFALHNFLYLVRKQNSLLEEIPTMDDPITIYFSYIEVACEIKNECNASISLYSNLLRSWEIDSIKKLCSSAETLVIDSGLDEMTSKATSAKAFEMTYWKKRKVSPQSERINVYLYTIKTDIERYAENIKVCVEEFKNYL